MAGWLSPLFLLREFSGGGMIHLLALMPATKEG